MMKCQGCTDCAACLELQEIYSADVGCSMIAPWRCTCLRNEFEQRVRESKQVNLVGCCQRPFRTKVLKRTGRKLIICDC